MPKPSLKLGVGMICTLGRKLKTTYPSLHLLSCHSYCSTNPSTIMTHCMTDYSMVVLRLNMLVTHLQIIFSSMSTLPSGQG